MHADTMRRIDCWLGIPTCAALTLVRRLGHLVRGRQVEVEPGPILFIKLALVDPRRLHARQLHVFLHLTHLPASLAAPKVF